MIPYFHYLSHFFRFLPFGLLVIAAILWLRLLPWERCSHRRYREEMRRAARQAEWERSMVLDARERGDDECTAGVCVGGKPVR